MGYSVFCRLNIPAEAGVKSPHSFCHRRKQLSLLARLTSGVLQFWQRERTYKPFDYVLERDCEWVSYIEVLILPLKEQNANRSYDVSRYRAMFLAK